MRRALSGRTLSETTSAWLPQPREVFAQQGGGASMEAIAKEAGVGIGTLYRHFPKRIDVVKAVYREDVDELVAAAETSSRTWSLGRPSWLGSKLSSAMRAAKAFLERAPRGFREEPGIAHRVSGTIEQALSVVLDGLRPLSAIAKTLTGRT